MLGAATASWRGCTSRGAGMGARREKLPALGAQSSSRAALRAVGIIWLERGRARPGVNSRGQRSRFTPKGAASQLICEVPASGLWGREVIIAPRQTGSRTSLAQRVWQSLQCSLLGSMVSTLRSSSDNNNCSSSSSRMPSTYRRQPSTLPLTRSGALRQRLWTAHHFGRCPCAGGPDAASSWYRLIWWATRLECSCWCVCTA